MNKLKLLQQSITLTKLSTVSVKDFITFSLRRALKTAGYTNCSKS
jgi:hypothetical protein